MRREEVDLRSRCLMIGRRIAVNAHEHISLGATGDFRNAYNHRFSPRFVFGVTGMVIRHKNPGTGQFYYGFGGRDALALTDIVDLLGAECTRTYTAFEALQRLVDEQIKAIVNFEAAEQAVKPA